MTTTTPSHPPHNAITADDLMHVAKELGAQSGKARDTQIKFLMKVTEASYHNAVDLKGNKHGVGIDDATKFAKAYVTASSENTFFDAKANNQQKLISTLRTGIKLGQFTKGGNGEPLATINNLMTTRQKLRANPAEAKKLDDAANTFLRFARAQLKRDTMIDGDELKQFCYKPVKDNQMTAEEFIEQKRKELDKLVKGMVTGGLQDASAEVRAARDALTKRLIDIAKAKGAAKMGAAA